MYVHVYSGVLKIAIISRVEVVVVVVVVVEIQIVVVVVIVCYTVLRILCRFETQLYGLNFIFFLS